MKKCLTVLVLLMLFIGTATAQQKARTFKEPRVRFGVGYRFNFGLVEQAKAKINDIKESQWNSPEHMQGGDLHLEGTVRIAPTWNVGVGVGLGLYNKDAYRSYRIYAKGEHLYGRRPSRWFNYAEVGISTYQYQDAGFTAGLGGGYRMAITRRTRLDLTAGLEYLNIANRGEISIDYNEQHWKNKYSESINRIGLTIGIAMHF